MHLLSAKPTWLLPVLVVPALWLATHPLLGVRHDAVLYLGQALARIHPEPLQNDLFLSLSGQDRFTLATALTSWLYKLVGVGLANAALLLVCQALSAGLLYLLIRPAAGTRAALIGMVLYACASHGYGPQQIFSFAEPFVTARTLAEPFLWAALLCWSRRGRWLAFALLCGATLMHPLIAMPGWVAIFCWMLRRDQRWGALLALPAGIALLYAATGVPSQLAPFDNEWLQAIEQRNVIFLHQMDLADWCKAALPALTIVSFIRLRPREAVLPVAVLDTAVLLTGAAAIAADLLHSALPTQLQLWRALWPMQALGLVLMPALVIEQCRRSPNLRWSIGLSALAALTAVNASAPWAFWLIVWWGSLQCVPERGLPAWGAAAAATTSALLLVSATAWSVDILSIRVQTLGAHAPHVRWLPWLATPVIALAVTGLGWRLFRARTRLAAAAGSFVLIASAAAWDQRPPLIRAVEGTQLLGSHPWQAFVPEQVPVMWPDHPEAVWALLQRPVFHDETQGAASVFNRELAMRFALQRTYFTELRDAKTSCELQQLMVRHFDTASCAVPAASLARLCSKLPEMRFFVGTNKWSSAWVSTWRAPDPSGNDAIFHLHDCKRMAQRADAVRTEQPNT